MSNHTFIRTQHKDNDNPTAYGYGDDDGDEWHGSSLVNTVTLHQGWRFYRHSACDQFAYLTPAM